MAKMEFDETTHKQLLRLAILCHSEHLMDRAQLVRSIELIHTVDATNVDQISNQIFTPTLLEELHQRLGRAQSIVAQMRGQAVPVAAAGGAVPLLSTGRDEAGYVAETLPEPVHAIDELEGPTQGPNDLHVNLTPRILWPVVGIGVCILLYYVISTLVTSDLFSEERRSDSGGNTPAVNQSLATGGVSDTPGDTDLPEDSNALNDIDVSDEPVQPRVNRVSARLEFQASLENFVVNKQYGEALELLNSNVAAKSSDSGLLEAGVLLAKGGVKASTEALDILVQPGIVSPQSDGWLSAYANALIYADKAARTRAIEAIANSSGRAMVRPDIRRAIEWAEARNGAAHDDLKELALRSSDFSATSRDHLFLAFSSIANGQNAQVKYHIGKASRKLPSLERQLDDTLPEWLTEQQFTQFTRAIEKVETSADSRK
ncbi:MAG: hypothetical protein Aurels2KO_40930 [Aureliella sp.]